MSVIACNTASTLVIDAIRERFPGHPFVGTVPAIKPAAERTRSGLVSVLATPGTVKRQYTRDLITQWASKCHVRLVGSHKLAALAETYMREGFVDEEAVRRGDRALLRRAGRPAHRHRRACLHALSVPGQSHAQDGALAGRLDRSRRGDRPAGAVAAATARSGARTDEPDLAVFTSGEPDFATRRLMQGFGLAVEGNVRAGHAFFRSVTIRRSDMPATSKAQQKAAGAALAAKRGEIKKSELYGASKEMYESMTEKQLEEFAETKRKGLPEHKKAALRLRLPQAAAASLAAIHRVGAVSPGTLR